MKYKLTIITPCYRIQNLLKIQKSIDFEYIHEWIIVYDGTKINDLPNLFQNDKIKEYICKGDGIEGNDQRNYGIKQIQNEDTYIYFLDDDNIIHPGLYTLLDKITDVQLYTFNLYKLKEPCHLLYGTDIRVGGIDTAMFLCHYSLIKGLFWIKDVYGADGYYIKECVEKNRDKHIFVNETLCYHNAL